MVKKKKIDNDNNATSAEELAVDSENIVDAVALKLEEAGKQVTEYKDIAQRLQAEFDNYRKRNNDSVKIARQDGVNEIIVQLLPILDALDIAQKMVADENALEGIMLVYKQIQNVLSKYEVTEIPAVGEVFNPTFHNAVMQIEDSENSGKVVEVLQKGYKRSEKVIRYAMVKVAN